jgi:hypothetical protein
MKYLHFFSHISPFPFFLAWSTYKLVNLILTNVTLLRMLLSISKFNNLENVFGSNFFLTWPKISSQQARCGRVVTSCSVSFLLFLVQI